MYGDQSTISRVENLFSRQTATPDPSHSPEQLSYRSCDVDENFPGNEYCRNNIEDNELHEQVTLEHLPVAAFLHILTYLDAKDISNLGMTCWQFHDICNDQHLWKDLLEKDKLKWNQVGHATNPVDWQQRYHNMSYKDIYMRCHPGYQASSQREPFNVFHIPKLLMSYFPKRRVPRVVLCGPGLDSDTSVIVRKMIGELAPETFRNLGPFPAMFPGSVGTGFTISMENKWNMRLITLYSGTKSTRETKPLENRSERSRLLQATSKGQSSRNDDISQSDMEDEEEEFNRYEPTPSIRHLCQEVDGFAFVVESSSSVGPVTGARQELHALLNPLWTPNSTPLLVLSCTPTSDTSRTPCVTIVEQLKLVRLTRPWKAMDAETCSLSGITQGFKWLLETIS